MNEPYVVFYKRDIGYEKSHDYAAKGIELYDRIEHVGDLQSARILALRNLPSVLVSLHEEDFTKENRSYVVAVRPDGKYTSSCMGEVGVVESWDVRKVKADGIEAALSNAHEGKGRVRNHIVGIEKKVL